MLPASSPDALSDLARAAHLDPTLLADLLAIPRSRLYPPNFNVWTVSDRLRSAHAWLDARRVLIAELRPGFSLIHIDDLARLGPALISVEATCSAVIDDDVGAAGIHADALRRRDVLFADVRALVAHDFLPASVVDAIHGGSGYVHVGPDLAAMLSAVRAVWPAIQGLTAITAADLDAAERAFAAIGALAQRRRAAVLQRAAAIELRSRVFVAAVGAYQLVRRQVAPLFEEAPGFAIHVPALLAHGPLRKPRGSACASSGPSAESAAPEKKIAGTAKPI